MNDYGIVFLGPPTTGTCVFCGVPVFKPFPKDKPMQWWGPAGALCEKGHPHYARPARPIETVVLQRALTVPVTAR